MTLDLGMHGSECATAPCEVCKGIEAVLMFQADPQVTGVPDIRILDLISDAPDLLVALRRSRCAACGMKHSDPLPATWGPCAGCDPVRGLLSCHREVIT